MFSCKDIIIYILQVLLWLVNEEFNYSSACWEVSRSHIANEGVDMNDELLMKWESSNQMSYNCNWQWNECGEG